MGEVLRFVRLFQPSTAKKRIPRLSPLSSQRRTETSGPAAHGTTKSREFSNALPVVVFSRRTADREVRARMTAPACADHNGQLQHDAAICVQSLAASVA